MEIASVHGGMLARSGLVTERDEYGVVWVGAAPKLGAELYEEGPRAFYWVDGEEEE